MTQPSPQTDYFCTVCEESLKEEELQSHLFEGHSAENLQVSWRVEWLAAVSSSGREQMRSIDTDLQYHCFL